MTYSREFVPLSNDPALAEAAMATDRTVLEPSNVRIAAMPMTASEDFAHFLDHVPGSFVFLGNCTGSAPLHNPTYDFNDESLCMGPGSMQRSYASAFATHHATISTIVIGRARKERRWRSHSCSRLGYE